MHSALRGILWSMLWLPLATFAQGTVTSTNSFSTGVGATNSNFAWTVGYVGPATIPTGNQGICTIPPPPYPNCTLFGGSGTTADPFTFSCSAPLPLSGCTLSGTPFAIVAGGIDFDTHVHSQAAFAAQGTPVPAPLGPWVPLASTIGIAMLTLVWLRRRDSRGVDARS
jgi:hypothetical protein